MLQCWTRISHLLPTSPSLPISLAGAETPCWLALEAETMCSREGEQKDCTPYAQFLLLCDQIKKLFLL